MIRRLDWDASVLYYVLMYYYGINILISIKKC